MNHLLPEKPGFASRSVHVESVVDKVALGQAFSVSPSAFPCQTHPTAAPYSLIYHMEIDNGPVSGYSSIDT